MDHDESDYEAFERLAKPVREAGEKLLMDVYGEKCPDFYENCEGCQRWADLEVMTTNPFDEDE